MNNMIIYSWLGACTAAILSISWRLFLSGDTLNSVRRKMEALYVETEQISSSEAVGPFLSRNDNRAIMRLCLLQMQLLVFSWWFSLLLAGSCSCLIGFAFYEPSPIVQAVSNHTAGEGVPVHVWLPILAFLLFIITTIFVAAYRRRLLDLTEEMKSNKS